MTSTNQANEVEWVNPASATFVSTTLVFRTNRFPTTPTDGTVAFTGGVAGAKTVFDHRASRNGATYYYAAFANLTGGSVSAGRFARGRPFDHTVGPVKWAYSTGATSVAPPGIGSAVVVASNDRVVHALGRGASGGAWPSSFTPVLLGGVAQSRPPVLPAGTLPGQPSLDPPGGPGRRRSTWWMPTRARPCSRAPPSASVLQGAVAGGFIAYGFPFDRLFIGTRNSSGRQPLLRPRSPEPRPRSRGSAVRRRGRRGARHRERRRGGRLRHGPRLLREPGRRSRGPTPSGASRPPPPASLSVVAAHRRRGRQSRPARQPRLRRRPTTAIVYAFDKMTGLQAWSFDTGGQPIKGFLFPDRSPGGTALYFATTDPDPRPLRRRRERVRAVRAPHLPRALDRALPSRRGRPAAPALLRGGQPAALRAGPLGVARARAEVRAPRGVALVIGAPSYDTDHGLVYVGSDAGIVYAVAVPLP